MLTDLALTLTGADVYDVLAKRLPDLFHGSQVAVFGRYRAPGEHRASLRGTTAGVVREFAEAGSSAALDQGSEHARPEHSRFERPCHRRPWRRACWRH